MAENKISRENAELQLDQFLDFYEIEKEQENDEETKNLKAVFDVVIKAIVKGRLEIKESENGFIVSQKIKNGETLEYKEVDGKAKLEMDRSSKFGHYSQMYALVGYLTGKGSDYIAILKGKDLKTAEALAALFLSA